MDGADAAEVVKVTGDLIIGSSIWEGVVGDKEIGLGDVGGRDVVPE